MARGGVGAGIAAAMGLAVTLGGCGIDKVDEHARQRDVIGDVEIATTFCTSSDTDEHSRACAPYERPHRGQALVAYRLPDGSTAPASLTDDGGSRHFSRSDSYTAHLEATYPEAGMHWDGYVSEAYSTGAGGQYAFTMSPEFPLPDPGKPFAGPYRYQVVGGYRTLIDPADDGSAPIDCSDSITTSCTSTGTPGADSLQPTRDLAVLPGGDVPVVEAGAQVAVPFDLRLAGAGGEGVRFGLAAATELDGAQVAPSKSALEPGGDSHNPVAVVVSVPAGTPPGTYEASLTATAPADGDTIIHKVVPGTVLRDGSGERRTGTMTFRVVAATPPPPPPPPPPDPGPVTPPPAGETVVPPPAGPTPGPVGEPPAPVPAQVEAPRARFRLSLVALPRHAYSGGYASYRVVARNVSHQPAVRARICERLPGRVQFVRASRHVRFAGPELCFGRRRLRGGSALTARVLVHVDTDARPGLTSARATATAANADRARARARMRVMVRAVAPRRAPVTG